MTFYGVLFAILFLGACREVLALWHDSVSTLPLAILVAVLVFSDGINTSELEAPKEKPKYTFEMKLIDLGSFLVLSLALILLSPEPNLFDVKVPPLLVEYSEDPPIIWLLLTGYWLLQMGWNRLAGELRGRVKDGALLMLGIFVVMGLWSWRGTLPWAVPWATWVVVLATIYYGFFLAPPKRTPGRGHRG